METKFLEMISDVFEMENNTLAMEDTFRDFEEWDSLAQLSLISEIDDVYDITIENEVFKTLLSLNDLFEEIQKRVKA